MESRNIDYEYTPVLRFGFWPGARHPSPLRDSRTVCAHYWLHPTLLPLHRRYTTHFWFQSPKEVWGSRTAEWVHKSRREGATGGWGCVSLEGRSPQSPPHTTHPRLGTVDRRVGTQG